MKRIQHNVFKMYTPVGVPDILTSFCHQHSIYKKQAYDFYKYIYIVAYITTHSQYQKTNREGCTLNIKTLSRILGTKDGITIQMVKNLVDLGIIWKDSNHQTGVKSATYTLTNDSPVWDEVIALPKYTLIPSKIIAKRNALRSKPSNDLKMYIKYVSNITLEVPTDYYSTQDTTQLGNKGGLQYNSSYSTSSISFSYPSSSTPSPVTVPLMLGEFSYNTASVKDTDDLTEGFCTTKKVNPYILSLEAIEQGNWFVHRKDEKSRVHTNLTNLKKDFRYFLRYGGNPLMELDIRNSQPLIATILIKDFWIKKCKIIPADVMKYQKDCEAGTFYDYFMIQNKVSKDKRGEFKAQMFGEVFFSKVSKRKTVLKKQFISKYPGAYEAICYIKGGLGSKTYNQFAIQLQRKEASIIFDTVNMGLLKQGIPAFNIFDSILCLPEHQEIASEKLLEAFSAFNITPTISITSITETPLKTAINIKYDIRTN